MRKKLLGAVILWLCSSTIAGARALPLASEQQPPKYIDETQLVVYLIRNSDEGYRFRVSSSVYGVGSKSDAVRFKWMSRGKVLADQRCGMNITGDRGQVSCDWEGKPLTAHGDISAQLIYIDDQNEKEYLLRELQVKVARVTWMKSTSYQILHDDNLGVAYAWHRIDDGSYFNQDHKLYLYFWMADSGPPNGAQMRCSVNGKRIPDFDVAMQSAGYSIEADMHVGGDERRYRWAPIQLYFERLWHGTREQAHKTFTDEDIARGETRILAELAGDWDCALRAGGNVLRQFAFRVDEQGRVAASPAQSAPGFPMTHPTVVWVDMRLPAKNAFDKRVRPDALKKSMPYGLAWPSHPIFDAARKAMPPASGLSDPK